MNHSFFFFTMDEEENFPIWGNNSKNHNILSSRLSYRHLIIIIVVNKRKAGRIAECSTWNVASFLPNVTPTSRETENGR